MFTQSKKARGVRAAKPMLTVYSIPALLRGRVFTGNFEVADAAYKFTYAPQRAEVVAGKLQLRGQVAISDAKGRVRSREAVRATLEGTQGGLGGSPIRRQLLAAGAQTGTVATAEQKQQLASESERKPGENITAQSSGLPVTDSTGAESFCGVLYFRLEPLDGVTLGVAADLSRVQLNARLAPVDDTGRSLRDLYSLVVEALYGERVEERVAGTIIGEINKVFANG